MLLYAGDRVDGGGVQASPALWLRQIASLRPRRPVDAAVLVLHSGDDQPVRIDGEDLLRQLRARQGALRWSVPCYLLYACEVGGDAPIAEEWIGHTWNDCRQMPTVDRALAAWTKRGVAALEHSPRQPGLARLSRLIEARSAELSSLVARWQPQSAEGVLFMACCA